MASATIACTKLPSNAERVNPESAHYKLFLEDGDHLSQTPAEVRIEIIPTKNGFMRVQNLDGPGMAFNDTLSMNPWGLPVKHVIRANHSIRRVLYGKETAAVLIQGDTATYMTEVQTHDIIQMDLTLAGMDTLKSTTDIPFFTAQNGNMNYYEAVVIGPDSIRSHFTSTEYVLTEHRYAVAPGKVYEAWYEKGKRLPTKIRLSASGNTTVYWKLSDEPVTWQ